MRSILDLEYKEGLFLDLYLPECEEFDLFVYFHGGGLERGSRKRADIFAKTLAERGVATASVDYRLLPEAKFPDFLIDAADSVRWLKDNIKEYGNMRRIFIGGSSAGGYISMMLCFDERYLCGVGISPCEISAYIHDAGQPTAHYNVLKYSGIDPRRVIVDERAPIYFVGTREEYPPMLFIVSDNDMFARYEQTQLMVKTLEHFGNKENVRLKVMHSAHCKYVYKQDECGNGVLGTVISEFLDDVGF